jgi:hypothetical protein
MPEFIPAILVAAEVFFRSRSDLALEILALRQQVAVLKRPRPCLNRLDRLSWTTPRRVKQPSASYNGQHRDLTSCAAIRARAAKGICFMPEARTDHLLDTVSGKPGTLTTLDKPGVGAISVSQGGAHVVWAQVDGDTRDLMLVENLWRPATSEILEKLGAGGMDPA